MSFDSRTCSIYASVMNTHSDRWRRPTMPRSSTASLLSLLLLLQAPLLHASEGDRAADFKGCVYTCHLTGCLTPELQRWNPEAGGSNSSSTAREDDAGGSSNNTPPCRVACPQNKAHYTPSLALRVTKWDCSSDCQYHCMWAIEARRAAEGGGDTPVYKYFGKWPFVRVLGAQEVASVVFSVVNLAAHVVGLRWLMAALPKGGAPPGVCKPGSSSSAAAVAGGGGTSATTISSSGSAYPYAWLWFLYIATNINAWLWSAVFHIRDVRLTERLDYFSADLMVAAGLLVVAVRAARLARPLAALPAAAVVLTGLLWHVRYMALVKFDYGYNVLVCIVTGVTTALAWVVWVTRARHPRRGAVYQFVGAVHAAMLLEVLDFSPFWGLLDAHALWHAATAPLTLLWYRFVVADVAWVVGGGGGSSSSGGGDSTGTAAAAAALGGGGGGSRGPSPTPVAGGVGRRRAVAVAVDTGKRDL